MAKGHSFQDACRICHWWYCSKCGLLQLKNEASRKAFEKPCPGAEKEDQVQVTVVRK